MLAELARRGRQAGNRRRFHRERRLDWAVHLQPDGVPSRRDPERLRTVTDLGARDGAIFLVPSTVRTLGIAPNLAADDAQYLLGWSDPDSDDARVARCHEASGDLHRRWAASRTGQHDPAAAAVEAFFDNHYATLLKRPDDGAAKSGVLLVVDGIPACDSPSAAEFWAAEVTARKAGPARGVCLVCGRTGALLDTMPSKTPARYLPGATNDAALVSVNERVYGYGLTTGLASTPICVRCGDDVTAGLNDALETRNSIGFVGDDSRTAWWYTGPVPEAQDPLRTLLTPGRVVAEQPPFDSGAMSGLPQAELCALTVAGNVGRVVVRSWGKMPLTTLRRHIWAWFEDTAISSRITGGIEHHGLLTFVRASGSWESSRGRYAELGAGANDRPADIRRLLYDAAVHRQPIPLPMVVHLVRKIRHDGWIDAPRAGLLRAALIRQPGHEGALHPAPGLDPENVDSAYLVGRILARIDVFRHAVYPRVRGTLPGVPAARSFSEVVERPLRTLLLGREECRSMIRRLRQTGARVETVAHLADLLDADFATLHAQDDLPPHFSLWDQATFLLGYHHQRTTRSPDQSGAL